MCDKQNDPNVEMSNIFILVKRHIFFAIQSKNAV